MTTIAVDNPVLTLINIFIVKPDRQQQLVDLLVRATEEVMQHQPGFISANIHQSLDGTRVVNYAQWRNQEDFEAMLQNPDAIRHMEQALSLAIAEPHLYKVAAVHHT